MKKVLYIVGILALGGLIAASPFIAFYLALHWLHTHFGRPL